MKIEVFGPGCTRCEALEQLVAGVAASEGGNITVEKVRDMAQMMERGIMSVPAIAIDGKLCSTGRIPSKEEIAGWIRTAREAG
ncbi:thioredoxin family protein [Oxalobacter sp. OttesenSCG-928-P03]|nr:thioredoxin family protein [Oxalobacter sp. OttesenSCG-928-P03]